jgi:DNA polymerase-3 subunit gamma/tau
MPGPSSFKDLVALFARHREAILHAHLLADVHLVRFEPGRIEFRPGPHAPSNLANRMGELLHRWTGRRWVVSVSKAEGAPTLKQQAESAEATARREAAADPLVRAVLETFPGATIEAVRERGARDAPDFKSTNGDESA